MLCFVCAGCNSAGKSSATTRGTDGKNLPALSEVETRTSAQNFADGYVLSMMQALDELIASTERPEIAEWAKDQKIATAMAAYTNATGPNPQVSCVDLVMLTTLKRIALERHWIPKLLQDEGTGVLATARSQEAAAWTAVGRVLTGKQIEELRGIIDAWVAEHPDQYYVGWVRLTDLSAAKHLSAQSPELKLPGNIFGLLYLDPLANLDPVAKEMRSYRDLTERLTYLLLRLPSVYSAQIETMFHAMTKEEQLGKFVTSTTRFAAATERFADAAARYPESFRGTVDRGLDRVTDIVKKEREAAIQQASAEVTQQRDAVVAALDAQQDKLRGILNEARGTVTEARGTMVDVRQVTENARAAASKTVSDVSAAVEGIVHTARNAVITVIVVACVVPMLTLLLYRRFAPRHKSTN